ncbi:hypothetical protein F2Q70_00002752 [Brassica cretica]|uniref:Uncharacterized protein n=1 Tax=Brassica cretica TaxID=69181 RepID=A0A8S9IY78_BRACR|nr:hypothetical protein F2Q70_00002752 [Brassica cretica]
MKSFAEETRVIGQELEEGRYAATEKMFGARAKKLGRYVATGLEPKLGRYVATGLEPKLGRYVVTEHSLGCYVATELEGLLGRYIATELEPKFGRYVVTERSVTTANFGSHNYLKHGANTSQRIVCSKQNERSELTPDAATLQGFFAHKKRDLATLDGGVQVPA